MRFRRRHHNMARAWSEAEFGNIEALGVSIPECLELRLCLGLKPIVTTKNPDGKDVEIAKRPKAGIRLLKHREVFEEVIFRPKLARRLGTDIQKLAENTTLRVILDDGMIRFEVQFPDCLYRTLRCDLGRYFQINQQEKPDNLAMAVTNAED